MSLPVIIVTDRHLRDISDDAWKALIAANDPPAVFQRGHDVVDIVWIDGRPTLRTLDISSFRGRLDRVGNFMALARGGPRPIPPPRDLVADMLASPELPLPLLEGIAYAPFFAASGQLVDKPGYHSASRRYLSLPKGLCMPRVSPTPDASAVARARVLLLDELLGEFCFRGEADKAHAVAALLLPFVRDLIPGPTPLHVVDSPSPGTGKDLLGDVLAIPAVGKALAVMPEGRDEDEFRRQITSVLDAGPQFVRIGNVQRPVKSPALAAALTGISWSDRLVGSSRQAVLPVLCAWLLTGNNVRLSLEISRRSILIRLDAGVERPWEREGFRHPDLRGWAMEHRGELIWAALTLVQAWMSAGKPPGAASLGSFEAWAQLMGGILDVARIPSFLGNQERLYEDADSEGPEWVAFCAAWWGQFQDSPVKAAALLSLAIGHGLLSAVWAGYKWHAALVRFGKALSQMRDRVFAGYRIRAERDRHTKMTVYRLEPTSQRAGAAGGASPPTTQGTTHSSTSRNIPQHPADPATVGSGPGYQWEAEVL